MKIGVVTDIHNNLPALEAVLPLLSGCEKIVCCGDVIGIGPHPEQVVRRLMRVPNLIAVRGNHDRYLLEGMPDAVPNAEQMGEGEMAMHRWEHARLSAESVEFLRALPLRTEFQVEGLRVAALHYCIDAVGRYIRFTPNPTPTGLDSMFADVCADVILYGHDHAPSVQRSSRALYVNCGSVGCPGRERDVARAGILELAGGVARFTPVRAAYDASRVIADIDRLAYPAAAEIKAFFFGMPWVKK